MCCPLAHRAVPWACPTMGCRRAFRLCGDGCERCSGSRPQRAVKQRCMPLHPDGGGTRENQKETRLWWDTRPQRPNVDFCIPPSPCGQDEHQQIARRSLASQFHLPWLHVRSFKLDRSPYGRHSDRAAVFKCSCPPGCDLNVPGSGSLKSSTPDLLPTLPLAGHVLSATMLIKQWLMDSSSVSHQNSCATERKNKYFGISTLWLRKKSHNAKKMHCVLNLRVLREVQMATCRSRIGSMRLHKRCFTERQAASHWFLGANPLRTRTRYAGRAWATVVLQVRSWRKATWKRPICWRPHKKEVFWLVSRQRTSNICQLVFLARVRSWLPCHNENKKHWLV